MSSALHILHILGLTDKRELVFTEPQAHYDFSREVVIFNGADQGKIIICAISREALEDHFGADNADLVKVFYKHHQDIEHVARRKYLNIQLQSDETVLITTEDC